MPTVQCISMGSGCMLDGSLSIFNSCSHYCDPSKLTTSVAAPCTTICLCVKSYRTDAITWGNATPAWRPLGWRERPRKCSLFDRQRTYDNLQDNYLCAIDQPVASRQQAYLLSEYLVEDAVILKLFFIFLLLHLFFFFYAATVVLHKMMLDRKSLGGYAAFLKPLVGQEKSENFMQIAENAAEYKAYVNV